MPDSEAAKATKDNCYDLNSLLTHSGRDFLVRNNGEQVKFDKWRGKKLGLYFSGSWCGPCKYFTPELIEVYNELSSKADFEIILISADVYVEEFKKYFSKMPWLAVPFSDSETRDQLNELFKIQGIPHLVILDEKGKVLSDEGVMIMLTYGAEGYPFTPERIKELTEQEEVAKKEQSLRSILVSPSRDFLLTNDGKKVPVSELEGKMVGLYFFHPSDSCLKFTPKLMEVYNKLKKTGKSFEIVMVFFDDGNEESFKQTFQSMPWFALPFKDKSCYKLARYFDVQSVPSLIIIGPDGKTLHSNLVVAVEEHGIQPLESFMQEKSEDRAEIEKAKDEAQTLESILLLGDKDYVIGKDGVQVPVSNLVGRNVLLYFSANWCPAHHDILPKLIEAYHGIKAKDDLFEVIFISSDNDQASFDEFFSKMPWLALPFKDVRNAYLTHKFKAYSIPTVVAIGPTGRTVTTEASGLIRAHGANAYPFTDKHLGEMKAELQEMVKRWPEKVKHKLHEEHQLVLSQRHHFRCDGCGKEGDNWSFYCEECGFDLHPKCALEEDEECMIKNLVKKAQSLIEKIVSLIQNIVFFIFRL